MSLRYLRACLPCRLTLKSSLSTPVHCRNLHLTAVQSTFWERDKKGGYNRELERKFWKKDVILSGLEELKGEIKLWKEEVKDRIRSDPILIHRPGEVDTAWSFKADEDFKKWVLTTDSDHLEGESKAKFDLSKDGHGLFHGTLSEKVPIDGKIKRAGYCNIKSMRARKSFKRETYLEWSQYNMLRMRIRGDGRSYLINIASEGEYDVLWNDVYHYVLYTRGGPYWQDVKIPFSKFFLASKGRVQDRQYPIALDHVTGIGFTIGVKGINAPGRFSLEIDYIGLEYDPLHTEEFAYEMYKVDRYIAAT